MEIRDELVTKIGHGLIDSAPISNWEKITFKYHQVLNWSQGFLFFFDTSGKETWVSARNVTPFADELRQCIAKEQGGKGTWYGMKMEIANNSSFRIDFDYHTKPDFGFEILDETFITDFKMFPRKAEYIPAWLKEILDRNGVTVQSI